jgi:hypothetical protein
VADDNEIPIRVLREFAELVLRSELVEAVQAQNTRAGSKRRYHLVILLHPDDRRRERGELQQVVDRLVDTLRFSEYQYVAVRHNDTDHGHIHVAPFRRQSCRAARRPHDSALVLSPRG